MFSYGYEKVPTKKIEKQTHYSHRYYFKNEGNHLAVALWDDVT